MSLERELCLYIITTFSVMEALRNPPPHTHLHHVRYTLLSARNRRVSKTAMPSPWELTTKYVEGRNRASHNYLHYRGGRPPQNLTLDRGQSISGRVTF